MRPLYIIFFSCLFVFTACNNNGGSTTTTNTTTTASTPALPAQSKLNDTGTHMVMGVITKYYALKNALVATRADNAEQAAAQLSAATDSLNAFLQNDTRNAALKPFVDTISAQSKDIVTTKDQTCEKQRLAFGTLSSALYGLLKNVDLKNARVYHEFCPMAFNDKGAYWLSDEADIKNPYFGKKMLECGEVTDSLK